MNSVLRSTLRGARHVISWSRVRINRATSYMGIANSILIALVYLEVGSDSELNKYKWFIAIGWFLILIGLGQIEILSRTPHTESEKMLHLQPPLKRMHDKIMIIDERLERMEAKGGGQ